MRVFCSSLRSCRCFRFHKYGASETIEHTIIRILMESGYLIDEDVLKGFYLDAFCP